MDNALPRHQREDAEQSTAPDLPTLLRCIRRRWTWALLGALLCGGMAFMVGLRIPALFKATAMIRLSDPQGLVDQPRESSAAQREFRYTQQELLKMPQVLRGVFEQSECQGLDNMPESVEELAELITLDLPRSSEILRVSIAHDSPETACVLVNAVVKAYLQELRRTNEDDLQKRLASLERLQSDLEPRLASSWREFQTLAREIGSGDPAALSLQTQAEIENYRAYSRRMREIQTERREAERQIRSIKETPETLAQEPPEDASMHSVKFAMFTAKLNRERAKSRWGDDHPEVRTAAHEESLLREYYQKTTMEEQPEPKSRQVLLAEPIATRDRLQYEEDSLRIILSEIEERLDTLGGDNAAKLEVMRNEVARMERLSDRLWQTREHLTVESHADPRVRLVSLASLPRKRDTSQRNKLLLLLTVAGFGCACALVGGGEFLAGFLHAPSEVEERTGLQLVASETLHITQLEKQVPSALASLDKLVAMVPIQPGPEGGQVVLLTSSESGDQHAAVYSHLANAFATAGESCCVLDLDFRRAGREAHGPSISELLDDKSLGPNVAEPVMWLRPSCAGQNPLPVLTGRTLTELVLRLKSEHPWVLVLTPPVNEFADAIHCTHFAQLSLLCITLNCSVSRAVQKAHETLEAAGQLVRGFTIA